MSLGLLRRWPVVLLGMLWAIPAAASGGEEGVDLTSRMMILVIQLGVILFAARIGNLLFEKLKLPGVLGELCAGMLIGPSLLGGVPIPGFHGFENGLFHVSEAIRSGSAPVSPELYGICTVASIVLLFLVGIETDLQLFVRFALAGGVVGLGGVIASFTLGDLMGVWLLPSIMEGTFTPFHPACIFLGVMSTATSVSITARILSERKKLDSPEGVTILAGAVIDDVLGIVMLAVGLGVIGAGGSGGGLDWGSIGLIAGKSVGIWLGATAAGILVARHISGALKFFGGKSEIAIMALGLALIVSGLFEEAKLAMIIGSYVMGLSLSRTDISHVVRESLHPLFLFMVPVFFTVMGMMVDLPMLLSPKILVFGLLYTVVAILSKLLGCGLPTLLCGFNLRGALRIGIGMVPRGEVALIVAGIGLSSGYLSMEVFGVAILMTLLTTVLPPPLLVKVFSSGKPGVSAAAPKSPPLPVLTYSFPSAEASALVLNQLLDGFRREGFYVHGLEVGELYQVRKDTMIINVSRHQNEIRSECDENEIPFMRTAMTEVVVEFEQTLRELRRPMNVEDIVRPTHDDPRSQRNERLVRYLRPEAMIPVLAGSTKDEVIAELVGRLGSIGLVSDVPAALATVMKREAAMSTGLRHGIACPHGRTDTVSGLMVAVGLKPEGLPFESFDGEPARIITLVLSPTEVIAPYMEFMAMMQSVLDEEGRAALLRCSTPAEMYAQLTSRRKG